ncbi:hypothetical protein Dtox_2168 [Desulfofarcimen acetoxidans DSM 771]|uniref:Uncharacterized protein n=1 Tax=Desulfofarcimen acetoxidans (strain ATCC 49208 / DSM 771 / KCTC 5769 / VKM B-1644 / 5575) TaxID=485916 RepID=C8VZ80_DESAS|nr:hypothetical protein Dtox_2168 [Desulfofarcimen acetoxidans DSM 771]
MVNISVDLLSVGAKWPFCLYLVLNTTHAKYPPI